MAIALNERGPGNEVSEAADAGPGAPGRHTFQELAN
jgi:hypothetical protein